MPFDIASPQTGNLLQAYGPEGFKVSGVLHAASILLGANHVSELPIRTLGEITEATIAPLLEAEKLEVLIIGTGARMQLLPPALRNAFRAKGLSVDAMDTGAACRTIAVLISEGRRAGALLLKP